MFKGILQRELKFRTSVEMFLICSNKFIIGIGVRRGILYLKTPSIGGTLPYLPRRAMIDNKRFKRMPERHRSLTPGDGLRRRLGSRRTLRVRNQTGTKG